jgi:hypothetical protein
MIRAAWLTGFWSIAMQNVLYTSKSMIVLTAAAVRLAVGCNTQCVCPDGSSPVNCFIVPCATTACPAGQQCVSDYCGGELSTFCLAYSKLQALCQLRECYIAVWMPAGKPPKLLHLCCSIKQAACARLCSSG